MPLLPERESYNKITFGLPFPFLFLQPLINLLNSLSNNFAPFLSLLHPPKEPQEAATFHPSS